MTFRARSSHRDVVPTRRTGPAGRSLIGWTPSLSLRPTLGARASFGDLTGSSVLARSLHLPIVPRDKAISTYVRSAAKTTVGRTW